MNHFSIALPLLLTALAPFHLPAADAAKPKDEMARMQMVLLSRPTDAKSAQPDAATLAAQRKATENLLQSGKLLFAGDCTGNGALREVLILRGAETNDARELAAALPAVKIGAWTAESLLWFGASNYFRPVTTPARTSEYFFGLLVRGTNAAKLPPDEVTKIQEGHMANIRRLADLGKLATAGPFVNGGDRRGIFIFKTTSLAEARQLTDTDPAVIAGRLRIELHPMQVPAGILR